MASSSSLSTPTSLFSSSSSPRRHKTLCSLSACVNSHTKSQNFRSLKWNPPLGLSPFSSWNGLRHLGASIPKQSAKMERKGKCKAKGVYASLFGVGAPEVLVIGVVALLVFGPKGLAEVARNLGKTLRAFQPTIRELQEVSREFKSTLEREIGLDEIQSSSQSSMYGSNAKSTTSNSSLVATSEVSSTEVDPNGAPSSSRAYSSEDYLKITEEQLKASAAQQQSETPPVESILSEPQTKLQDAVQEAAALTPTAQKPENEG